MQPSLKNVKAVVTQGKRQRSPQKDPRQKNKSRTVFQLGAKKNSWFEVEDGRRGGKERGRRGRGERVW